MAEMMMGTSVFPDMLETAQGTLVPHTLATGLLFTAAFVLSPVVKF